MKKMYTNLSSLQRISLPAVLMTGFLLLSGAGFAQTYYSNFPDPLGKAYITNAGGEGCTATPALDTLAFADSSMSNFSYFTLPAADTFTCSIYHFLSRLNLPADTPFLGTGYNAGFRIRVPSGIALDSLRKYIVLSSYTSDGMLVESKYFGDISGTDSGTNGVDWYLYFTPSLPFNTMEITVDPNIGVAYNGFEFQVWYAFASNWLVLPAQINNFTVAVSGKSVNVSWQSLTETNVANYRIERSSDGGANYSSVGVLTAKGNANAAVNYAYTDKIAVNGTYLYRVVTVNKDGSSKATNSLAAVIKDGGSLLLYPSVAKAGQIVTVKTNANGLIAVYLYDVQGRLIKEQRTTSSGQFTIATNGLAAGVYHIKVIPASGDVLTAKMIID